MCAHTYVQLAEIVNRNTLYNSGRFNIENFYTTYIRVVYANKHNAILHYVFLIFQRDKRKTRQKKKKEKNNFDITLRNFIRHKFTKLCTPFPPTIPPRTKIEKGTKKKKQMQERCKEKMRVAQLSRAKNFSSSLTLFFFLFSFLLIFFRLFLLYLLHPILHRTIAWISSQVHRFLARLRRSTI